VAIRPMTAHDVRQLSCMELTIRCKPKEIRGVPTGCKQGGTCNCLKMTAEDGVLSPSLVVICLLCACQRALMRTVRMSSSAVDVCTSSVRRASIITVMQ